MAAKRVAAKKKGSKKVTAAIRRRMNRELVESTLLTSLNSVSCILDDAFLNETLNEKEAGKLADMLDQLKSAIHKTFYTLRVGDEVSVCNLYKSGNEFWHDGHIALVNSQGVWLESSNDDEPWGPFDPTTGNDLRSGEQKAGESTVFYILFDHGYQSQHFEDRSLGEGDTL